MCCRFLPLTRYRKRVSGLLLCLSVVMWSLVGVQSAEATPVINAFVSQARLEADGTLLVTETITANMPGGGHGMFRDIPFAVKLPSGQVVAVPPAVLAVSVDGTPMPTSDTERMASNVLRIYMRDTSRELAEGTHTFSVSYSMPWMVGYFEERDELNWNATGDLWGVPIEKAYYSLTLPNGATIGDVTAWVGVRGSQEKAVEWHTFIDNGQPAIQFASLRALPAGEGFTCAVSWNKGVVAQPAPPKAPEFAAWTSTAPLALAVLIWAYFCLVWWRFGKDPAKGVVVPQFYPPKAPASFGLPPDTPLSPATVNYLMNATTLTTRGLSALFISLVCRKLCAISGSAETGFILKNSGTSGKSRTASSPYAEEKAVYASIGKNAVPLDKNGADTIGELMQTAQNALTAGCPALWTLNMGWTFLGAALGATGIIGCALLRFGMLEYLDTVTEDAIFMAIFLLLVAIVVVVMPLLILQGGRPLLSLSVAVVEGLLIWLVGAELADCLDFVVTPPLFLAGMVMTLLAPCVFWPLMKAPSTEARKLMDACEGLALYIGTAETARFRQFNPPERTPELFTRLLPYAVALNLEKAWGENCADALEQALTEDKQRQDMDRRWYSTGTAAVVSGTAQGMAAYEASKSSSTEGGGGGSGSGGGGGGGGFC